MPWKDTTAMEHKIEFIHEWLSNQYTVTELCEAFGISRATAHKYIRRFCKEGHLGLGERSRAPRCHPNQTDPEVEQQIIQLRKQHPRWGADKIWKLLQYDFELDLIPTTMTINNIMKRNGLILPRKRIKRIKTRETTRFWHEIRVRCCVTNCVIVLVDHKNSLE